LRTDPQFFYEKPGDLVNGYRVITKEIDPQLAHEFGKLPRLTYGVVEIPAFTAPSQTTAYYQAGSPEAGRPGSYFVNTYNLKARPKWEMEALSLHESVPGHHLQIALAQEQEGVPEFRKHSGYTAFVEGWGLYAESLGPELGMYKDPYSKFGQLTYEMWRAVRLVVDTGMHSMGWTRQQAIDFFRENTSKTDQDITVEVDRYIVWPGQALAYKIGQMKIRELRTEAEKELGSKFNVRTFHDAVLEQGAVPLDLLQAHVEEWMKEQSGRVEK
jgi:prolyl oligopeptidase